MKYYKGVIWFAAGEHKVKHNQNHRNESKSNFTKDSGEKWSQNQPT